MPESMDTRRGDVEAANSPTTATNELTFSSHGRAVTLEVSPDHKTRRQPMGYLGPQAIYYKVTRTSSPFLLLNLPYVCLKWS